MLVVGKITPVATKVFPTISNCKFKGVWTALQGLDADQSGIEVRGLGALTSENILIDNCQFTQLSIGMYSIYDTQSITVSNSLFTFLHVGIDLGRNSSGIGSQSQGPRHYLITKNKFDKVDDYGVAVHVVNGTSPWGHTSSSNIFVDVANNGNGQNSPQTSVCSARPYPLKMTYHTENVHYQAYQTNALLVCY